MRWRCVAWSWPASSQSHGWRLQASCSASGQRCGLGGGFPIAWRRHRHRTRVGAAVARPEGRRRRVSGSMLSDIRDAMEGKHMTSNNAGDAAKAVVRRNTEEVQGGGNFEVFEKLFADDFLDHTPQPGRTPDKDGARQLYKILRTAFPDFHADIHWQVADGDRVTTYKTYHGTHRGEFLGVAPTGRQIQFETVDVMRVRNGKITEHWGVANLFSLMQQLGNWPAKQDHS